MASKSHKAGAGHIGKTIDDCVLEKKLGQGGMGIAYLAKHKELKRDFVIKILNPSLTGSEDTIERFYREARSVARLNHPNIVAIQNVGQEGDFYFIRMEYCDGVTLESHVRKHKKQHWLPATYVIAKTARALAHAHSKGIIHRDIKPENLMFNQTTGDVKVMDYGLAKEVKSGTRVSITGQIVGTPFFMSPEQAGGKTTDARSDIYSLGVTYYYLLTGVKPFNGKNLQEIFLKHFFYSPESPKIYTPDLPEEVCEIIRRCLKKKKKERYQSAKQLAEDLESILAKGEKLSFAGPAGGDRSSDPASAAENSDVARAMEDARSGGEQTIVNNPSSIDATIGAKHAGTIARSEAPAAKAAPTGEVTILRSALEPMTESSIETLKGRAGARMSIASPKSDSLPSDLDTSLAHSENPVKPASETAAVTISRSANAPISIDSGPVPSDGSVTQIASSEQQMAIEPPPPIAPLTNFRGQASTGATVIGTSQSAALESEAAASSDQLSALEREGNLTAVRSPLTMDADMAAAGLFEDSSELLTELATPIEDTDTRVIVGTQSLAPEVDQAPEITEGAAKAPASPEPLPTAVATAAAVAPVNVAPEGPASPSERETADFDRPSSVSGPKSDAEASTSGASDAPLDGGATMDDEQGDSGSYELNPDSGSFSHAGGSGAFEGDATIDGDSGQYTLAPGSGTYAGEATLDGDSGSYTVDGEIPGAGIQGSYYPAEGGPLPGGAIQGSYYPAETHDDRANATNTGDEHVGEATNAEAFEPDQTVDPVSSSSAPYNLADDSGAYELKTGGFEADATIDGDFTSAEGPAGSAPAEATQHSSVEPESAAASSPSSVKDESYLDIDPDMPAPIDSDSSDSYLNAELDSSVKGKLGESYVDSDFDYERVASDDDTYQAAASLNEESREGAATKEASLHGTGTGSDAGSAEPPSAIGKADVATVSFKSAGQVFSNAPTDDEDPYKRLETSADGEAASSAKVSLADRLPIPLPLLLSLGVIVFVCLGVWFVLHSEAKQQLNALEGSWDEINENALPELEAFKKRCNEVLATNLFIDVERVSNLRLRSDRAIQELLTKARATASGKREMTNGGKGDDKEAETLQTEDLQIRRKTLLAKRRLKEGNYEKATEVLLELFQEILEKRPDQKDGIVIPMTLKTTPPGADVYINDGTRAERQKTPCVVMLKPTLDYKIRLRQQHFADYVENLTADRYHVIDHVLKREVTEKFTLTGSRVAITDTRAISTPPSITSPPIYGENRKTFYVASREGLVRAFNLNRPKIWPQPALVGRYGDLAIAPAVTQRAVFSAGSGLREVINEREAYFTICAIDPTDGTKVWHYDTGAPCVTSPGAFPREKLADGKNVGVVCVGTVDSRILFLDMGTGQPLKDRKGNRLIFETEGILTTSVVIRGNYAYFGCSDNRFYSVEWNATPPRLNDYVDLPSDITVGPVITETRAYIATDVGSLHAIKMFDGEKAGELGLIWSTKPLGKAIKPQLACGEGRIYYSVDNQLKAINLNSGKRIGNWSIESKTELTGPAYSAEGVIYVGTSEGQLHAYDSLSGELNWRFECLDSKKRAHPITTPPLLLKDRIVVLNRAGNVFAFAR